MARRRVPPTGSADRGPAHSPLPVVVAVGLGPAGPEHVTRAGDEALRSLPALLRTARHPSAAPYLEAGAEALDRHYEAASRFEDAYAAIVESVVAAARAAGRVAYGVPGSPYVAETTVEMLRADGRIRLEVVPGLSFVDLAWDRLGIDPVRERVRFVDAERFAVDAAGDTGPLLVAQAWSSPVLSDLKVALEEAPAGGAVILHHLGLPDEVVREVAWEEIDRVLAPDHLTSLYIPLLAEPVGYEIARALEIVRVLRMRCPWDAEQTHASLVRHLMEEAYEAIDAIDELGEPPEPARAAHLEEELGDVLCQVLFHSVIAAEEGLFNLSDVAAGLADKLVRRHPHVFAGAEAPPADEVLARWEQQKQEEKGRESLLSGIPAALPALELVAKYERRAGSVGLGYPVTGAGAGELGGALERLAQGDPAGAGELLIGVARLAAHLGEDPELALRHAAAGFAARFAAVERAAAASGATLSSLQGPEPLRHWRAAAGAGDGPSGS